LNIAVAVCLSYIVHELAASIILNPMQY